MDAAHIILQVAKCRCYTLTASSAGSTSPVTDLADDDEAWAALDDVQGCTQDKGKERKPEWLPQGMQPVLEELPKWSLLGAVLKEIEEEIVRQEGLGVGRYLYIFYIV